MINVLHPNFNYFVQFLSLVCIIINSLSLFLSLASSLPFSFELIFNCFDLFLDRVMGGWIVTNIHSWRKLLHAVKNRSEFDREEFAEFDCSPILGQINRKRRGREVYMRGYIIVGWIFNVYLILTALNTASFGSFELESFEIVNKFYSSKGVSEL